MFTIFNIGDDGDSPKGDKKDDDEGEEEEEEDDDDEGKGNFNEIFTLEMNRVIGVCPR